VSARFGRYELVRPLGRGGMAEVFLARYVGPEGFEKRLVIKRVLPQLADDRRLLRMFFEEARTQVSMSHGNLVAVFDFGRVGNDYFIAMEHVAGADLATVVANERAAGRALPVALVAHVGIELCRALGYVHRRGFVHRDLTPRNVLLSADGEVKLSDFGVALAVASEADPGLRGTLSYMAPEQAKGDRVDGRADLFSLGLVLGEALEGRRLRRTVDDEAALDIARAGAPIVLDGPLGALLARATQTLPDARFASADDMLAALEAVMVAQGASRERSVRELAGLVPTSELPPETRPAAPPAPTATTGGATINLHAERPPTQDGSAVETYFRDKRSPTFVEEVLGRVTPAGSAARTRRARVGAALALLTAAALGGVAVWRVASPSRAPTPSAATTASAPTTAPTSPASTATPSLPAPAPSTPTLPAPARAPAARATTLAPAPSAPGAPRIRFSPARQHATARRAPAASDTAQLVIQCTPWCVPYVDGQVRGSGGRSFSLAAAAGPHKVEVRRLEDHQQKTVDLRAREPQVLKFTFD
jgi:tRNA A-37 threonylcarbamoyl transferase component Bud32